MWLVVHKVMTRMNGSGESQWVTMSSILCTHVVLS
jgi:hypothetical protein